MSRAWRSQASKLLVRNREGTGVFRGPPFFVCLDAFDSGLYQPLPILRPISEHCVVQSLLVRMRTPVSGGVRRARMVWFGFVFCVRVLG